MIRKLHRWPGLVALALLIVLTLSGAALSLFPAMGRLRAVPVEAGLSVATLASRIQSVYPGVEQIKRAPSGQITAYWFEDGTPGAAVVDPASGQAVASADPNPVERWLTNLHRSLFLGDGGRITMALGALAMLGLALSGVALVLRRVGGARRWFTRLRGPLAGRLHVEIARIAVLGLGLSALTALWMTASTFDLLPDAEAVAAFPGAVSGQMGAPLADMAGLRDVPVAALRALSFPYAGDATDVYTLTTSVGTGYIDQGTGERLSWAQAGVGQRISETVYMLHTGQGAALLGVLLGLMALGVPALAVTGVLIWLAGRRSRVRIHGNRAARDAETIVLVGSEGGTTWALAATLHKALSGQGQSVHVAPMSAFAPERYARVQRIIVLSATYGDGDAPASAKGFLDRLGKSVALQGVPMAVLGLGDRSFPAFCGYAQAVARAAEGRGWQSLLPLTTIDRQSPQQIARWGRALGAAMGAELELVYEPVRPPSHALRLISRRDYGVAVQAPTAILRFARPRVSLWQRITGRGFVWYQAGDLIGIVPEGSAVPRLYSLASGQGEGFVEIVVRLHPGGLCSGQLMQMVPGDSVQGFVRRNAAFHAGVGTAPLILIGAGTGIGPLAGIIRDNWLKRPVHLFFGMRDPGSDFLYDAELALWRGAGHLTTLSTAVSRGAHPSYVQDRLRAERAEVVTSMQAGARIMVCGGREMAAGVAEALADILTPLGLELSTLKAEGRYVEDVY